MGWRRVLLSERSAKPGSVFKSARSAMVAGDLVAFATAAEVDIPRLLGVPSGGTDIGAAVRDWVLESCSFAEASERVISELQERSFLPSVGSKLSKWFLSCGMFTAAVIAESIYSEAMNAELQGSTQPSPRMQKWAAMAAIQRSDREEIERIASTGAPMSSPRSGTGKLSWTDVARIALGESIPRAGDKEFSNLVTGRSIGVLGPAPTSEAAVEDVKSCDLVAAPVRQFQHEGLVSVGDEIDIAYVYPWAGRCIVDWKYPGVLVLRDAKGFTALDHAGPVRQCIVLPGTGFVGFPTAVPDIVADLLAAGASEVRIAGANFYITEGPSYRPSEVAIGGWSEWNSRGIPFSGISHFSSHPPIENRNFTRTLTMWNKCSVVDFDSVMTMTDVAAANVLEKSWSLQRR